MAAVRNPFPKRPTLNTTLLISKLDTAESVRDLHLIACRLTIALQYIRSVPEQFVAVPAVAAFGLNWSSPKLVLIEQLEKACKVAIVLDTYFNLNGAPAGFSRDHFRRSHKKFVREWGTNPIIDALLSEWLCRWDDDVKQDEDLVRFVLKEGNKEIRQWVGGAHV